MKSGRRLWSQDLGCDVRTKVVGPGLLNKDLGCGTRIKDVESRLKL